MCKYLKLLKTYQLVQLAFRVELVLWFIIDTLPLGILLFVWSSIFTQNNSFQGFTLSGIIFYYLLSIIMRMLTASPFEEWRVDEIRNGNIDRYLIQPAGYIQHIFTQFVAGKSIYSALNLPLLLGVVFFFSRIFQFTIPTLSFDNVIPILTLIIFSLFFNFSLGLLIVLLGFWLENAENLEHFKWLLVSLLSGQILPIDLMPETLQKITWALPFKYLIGIPGMVALNKYDLVIFDYLYMLVTLGLSTLLLAFIWHKAKYKYSSIGG